MILEFLDLADFLDAVVDQQGDRVCNLFVFIIRAHFWEMSFEINDVPGYTWIGPREWGFLWCNTYELLSMLHFFWEQERLRIDTQYIFGSWALLKFKWVYRA